MPTELEQAYQDWLDNNAYVSGENYRLKRGANGKNTIAPWNKAVRAKFGGAQDGSTDFHRAAHIWKYGETPPSFVTEYYNALADKQLKMADEGAASIKDNPRDSFTTNKWRYKQVFVEKADLFREFAKNPKAHVNDTSVRAAFAKTRDSLKITTQTLRGSDADKLRLNDKVISPDNVLLVATWKRDPGRYDVQGIDTPSKDARVTVKQRVKKQRRSPEKRLTVS